MIEVFCPNVLIIYPGHTYQTDIHQNLSDKCCASLLWFIFSLPNWSIRTVSLVFAQYRIDCDSCDTHLTSPIKHSFLQPQLWARPASFQTSTRTFYYDLYYITENLQSRIHGEGKSWMRVKVCENMTVIAKKKCLYVGALLVRVSHY